MTMSATIDSSGRLTLEIPDDKGEIHYYRVYAAATGEDAWACRLAAPPPGITTYRVAVDREGAWRCSCPDMIYSRRRLRSRERGAPCKHVEAVAPLYAALCGLTPS